MEDSEEAISFAADLSPLLSAIANANSIPSPSENVFLETENPSFLSF